MSCAALPCDTLVVFGFTGDLALKKIEALAAPDTIDTMPEKTLLAFADHGRVGAPMAVGLLAGLHEKTARLAAAHAA